MTDKSPNYAGAGFLPARASQYFGQVKNLPPRLLSVTSKKDQAMKVVIRLSSAEELKALPILLRHSSGSILPDRTYVISEAAARTLSDAGVRFAELSRESNVPVLEGVAACERI